MLQVYLAFPKSLISQRFGENDNGLYASQGLKGHTTYDWDAPWDTPIPFCVPNSFCYAVLNKDAKDLQKYRGVYTLVQCDEGKWYEVSYGHYNKIYAEVGKTYQVGDASGTVGNTGSVYSGERLISLAEKLAGSHAGAHLHGPQIRPVVRVKVRTGRVLLNDGKGPYRDAEGYFYEVLDYGNGYNGCVSLRPFSTEILASEYRAIQIAEKTLGEAATALASHDSIPVGGRPYFLEVLSGVIRGVQTLINSLGKKTG